MLTKEQSILHFDFQNQRVHPDRLTRKTHAHYLPLAQQMLAAYRQGVGQPRRTLHKSIRLILQNTDDCSTRRIAAFCKLLDDASEYRKDTASKAAKLRERVFLLAATKHPLVQATDQLFDHAESEVKQQIAKELNREWDEIESVLFNDVIEFHPLIQPPKELDAGGLLRCYNVAQTQAALYGALSMTVWAERDFKQIMRYAKLARLMHSIEPHGTGYRLRFDGPASVVRSTRRYGVALAKFLPGLLSAEGWRMQATVLGPMQQRYALRLSPRDGLRSEVRNDDFDSDLEKSFYEAWQQAETAGWVLLREATILHQGQSVFMPDFTLRHPIHGDVLLEIVGFWTPEYLQEKGRTLNRFRDSGRILLAISHSVAESIPELGMPRIEYNTKLSPARVLKYLKTL
ncbi:hypothetical protein Poly41_10420 [Novipirellula artificiosorum]|uniref:DUF790 domain-containing protein n=2 Tax=Novipirellula artificiosorum TaxID=2528016 RepID=A0A5C6E1F9_9BACT|nr:hypothetical protein Poly41_10420 [Novipirellula artificiosorum]